MIQQSQECVIALDVGGTTISYSIIDGGLSVVEPPRTADSLGSSPQEKIIDHFSTIIDDMVLVAKQHRLAIQACSIAFPGPFEYKLGIPLLKHKFQALYGYNLKEALSRDRDFSILFLNDADAFGYGVLYKQFTEPPNSLVCITLGTGIGVSYFKQGNLVDLEIWNMPYKGKILEDFVSAQAITNEYAKLTGNKDTARGISSKAAKGEEAALTAFETFGNNLGEGLAVAVGHLHPNTIVFGGAISQSFNLFGGIAQNVYRQKMGHETIITPATNVDAILYGATAFALSA